MLTVLIGGRWVVGRGTKWFFKTLVPQINNINRERTFLMDRSNSLDDRYLDGDGSSIKNFYKRKNHLPFNFCLKQVQFVNQINTGKKMFEPKTTQAIDHPCQWDMFLRLMLKVTSLIWQQKTFLMLMPRLVKYLNFRNWSK